jgi:hypothetical protein
MIIHFTLPPNSGGSVGEERAPPVDRDTSVEIPGYSSLSEPRDSAEENIPMQQLRSDSPYGEADQGNIASPQPGDRTVKKGIYVYRE